MKVVVANSSDINQCVPALSRSFVPVLCCNVTFLEAFASLRERKESLGMFGVADFQNVSI